MSMSLLPWLLSERQGIRYRYGRWYYGEPDDFVKTVIGSVHVDVADTHPTAQINEAHFVIEIYPVRLKWVM